jgi:DNA-binding GntR family transcriptional regulator
MAESAKAIRDELVYQRLQSAIVSGELSPGERLVEEDLAERLGETRGVIHGALIRLSHDGLVVRERHRGAHVRRVSTREAIEVLEARRAIESLAAGYAAVRRTEADVEDLRRLLAEMEQMRADSRLLELSAHNSSLHQRILEISDHAVAAEVSRRLRPQVVRFQFRTVLAPGRADRSFGEHSQLVEAIATGDRHAAEDAMYIHLTHVIEALAEMATHEPMLV